MSQLTDADRSVIVDAGVFCCRQIFLRAVGNPSSCQTFVAESDGSDGTSGVTLSTYFTAGRVQTEQASGCFFLKMHSLILIHNYSVLLVVEKRGVGKLYNQLSVAKLDIIRR